MDHAFGPTGIRHIADLAWHSRICSVCGYEQRYSHCAGSRKYAAYEKVRAPCTGDE